MQGHSGLDDARAASAPSAGRTHGKVATYNAGCRCDECRAANADRQRRKRARVKTEEARVRSALEFLAENIAARDVAERDFWWLRTVGQVVRTPPSTRWCVFGKPQHLSNIRKGQIRHAYRRCNRPSCPNCADEWVSTRLRAVLRAWKDAPVWSISFADEKDWTKRGKVIRDQYPKRYFWIRVGADDEDGPRIVFVPGEVDGAEEVEDVGRALCAALLDAPADLRHVNRHSGVRVTPEREPTGWWVLDVVSVETANRIAEEILGRSLARDQQDKLWRGLHEYSHSISGLTEDEIWRVREALLDWITPGDREPVHALGGTG